LRDLINRDRPHGQKVDHKADCVWNVTVAVVPAPDVPRGDVEQFCDACLRKAERGECFLKFGRGRGVHRSSVLSRTCRLIQIA